MALLFRQILEKAGELVPSEAGAILLDEPLAKASPPRRRQLHFVAAFGPAAEQLMGRSLPASQGVAGHVYCTGTAHLAADAALDELFADHVDRSTGYSTRTLIAAPIVIGDSVCGTIELLNRASPALRCARPSSPAGLRELHRVQHSERAGRTAGPAARPDG